MSCYLCYERVIVLRIMSILILNAKLFSKNDLAKKNILAIFNK